MKDKTILLGVGIILLVMYLIAMFAYQAGPMAHLLLAVSVAAFILAIICKDEPHEG